MTLWTIVHQAFLSMGFARQEHWSELLCPPPGALPHPGIEPAALKSPELAGRFFTTSTTYTTSLSLFKLLTPHLPAPVLIYHPPAYFLPRIQVCSGAFNSKKHFSSIHLPDWLLFNSLLFSVLLHVNLEKGCFVCH